MADTKITALTAISTVDPAVDVLPIVDVSDTTMAASGTTKKITSNQILGAGGTATLASATITGDLTVDTSTLKVDSANNRVGIGTASPAAGAVLGVLGATSVSTTDYIGSSTWAARFIGSSNGASSGISLLTNSAGGFPAPASIHATPISDYRSAITATYSADSTGAGYFAVNRFNPTAATTSEHYKIDNTGVATWSNVGGVAGTAMTLNSTGLGVGRTPLTTLDAFGANKTNANEHGTLTVSSSDSYAIDKGGSIAFFGKYNSSSGNACFARIYGAKENSTDGSFTGYFAISTSPGGTPTERFRIDSSGNVGVGVTPSAKLDVYQATLGTAYFRGGYSARQLTLTATSDGVNDGAVHTFLIGSSAGQYKFSNSSGTLMSLDASGNLILQSSATPATLTVNGQLTVNATSNTNLRFSYRGSDGVTRVANLTLA